MLISDAIHIWRAADGEYHLEWQVGQPDTRVTVDPVVPSSDAETVYHSDPEPRASITGLPPGSVHYFRLRDQHGNEIIAPERKLGMQGTPNFRDFGGYSTTRGKQVKWGYLFRSGQLSRLTGQDVALLASLELDLICDFRREEEQHGDPSLLPAERAPKVLSLPITPGSNAAFFESTGGDDGGLQAHGRQDMFDFMVEINRDFALAQTDTYSRMFREILELEDARFLVHCAAGKDRTGFAAAIVLLALGVSEELVMRDYMLTSRYFNPAVELERIRQKYQMDQSADAILPMLEVHESYLGAALAEIHNRYPSVEAYLDSELGMGGPELAELRGRYLG